METFITLLTKDLHWTVYWNNWINKTQKSSRLPILHRFSQFWRTRLKTSSKRNQILSQFWCGFDRASSIICGNKMQTRCNRWIFLCRNKLLIQVARVGLKTWNKKILSNINRSAAHPASYTMGTGSLPGVKRPGRGVDHPTLSSAEIKQRVQLYLYSPSGNSWSVLGWPLPLYKLN
jgi:hypothetical protein